MTPAYLIRIVVPAQPPPDGGGGDSGPGFADFMSDPVGSMAQSMFDAAMQKVWDAGVWVLRAGFTLADQVSWVDPSTVTGRGEDRPDSGDPAAGGDPGGGVVDGGALWPSLLWVAALIALGLFFFQLVSVAVRGGRGMFRAFTGPLQFGLAIALTGGAVAVLLTAADGLTEFFLSRLSEQGSFTSVMDNETVSARVGAEPDLGDSVEDGVRSMLLGLAALFGIIPAGIGFALQMIFRQAAILVLVATIPLVAAGLVADATASWFWRTARWIIAAILMKPALALVLLIGVGIMARAEEVAGLVAGVAVLLVSLFCPMVLYRLLAFVDPGTSAGHAVRSGGSRGSGEPGSDGGTSEAMNIARQTQQAYRLGGGSSGSGGGSSAAGGELGGTTASPAASGGASGGGTGAASAAGGAGGAGAGGAGAAGVAGGAAAAAVVGGYLATKAAAGAAGGYGSGQMAQTGVGHPGPAPAAGGGQLGSMLAAGGSRGGQGSDDGDDPGPDTPPDQPPPDNPPPGNPAPDGPGPGDPGPVEPPGGGPPEAGGANPGSPDRGPEQPPPPQSQGPVDTYGGDTGPGHRPDPAARPREEGS